MPSTDRKLELLAKDIDVSTISQTAVCLPTWRARPSHRRLCVLTSKKLVRGSNQQLSFNRPLRAAPSEVARWVSAAWKAIPESIIIRSFKKCCISNALGGSEDDFLWEDDGEDKDDSDWVTDSDSVMSDDGESDE